MTKIYLAANDQLLVATTIPVLAAGDKKTVKVHVDFSGEWEGMTTTAVFFTADDSTPYEKVLDANNECEVPQEVLAKSGILYIGARGVSGAYVKTSTLVKYKIKDGAPTGKGTSVEPTATVYQQLLTAYGEAKSEVVDIRKRFEETLKKTYKTYDLLWENPDPTVDFEGKSIQLGEDVMSRYGEFMVTYKETNPTVQDSLYFYVKHVHEFDGEPITGTPGGDEYYMQSFSTNGTPYTRIVTVKGSYISFDDCRYYSNGQFKTNNDSLIPCKIYGVNQQVRTDIDALVASAVEGLFIPVTQAEYDSLVATGTVDDSKYYMIVG